MLQDGASGANLFGRGEHSVEDVIAFLELVVVIIIFRVWGEVWKVVIIGQVIPIIPGPLFRVDRTRPGKHFAKSPPISVQGLCKSPG
jgi:hypothetical protein